MKPKNKQTLYEIISGASATLGILEYDSLGSYVSHYLDASPEYGMFMAGSILYSIAGIYFGKATNISYELPVDCSKPNQQGL